MAKIIQNFFTHAKFLSAHQFINKEITSSIFKIGFLKYSGNKCFSTWNQLPIIKEKTQTEKLETIIKEKPQAEKLIKEKSQAEKLGKRKVLPVIEDFKLRWQLYEALLTCVHHECMKNIPLLLTNFAMVDGKNYIIVMVDLPEDTPLPFIPASFKGIPVLVNYGVIDLLKGGYLMGDYSKESKEFKEFNINN